MRTPPVIDVHTHIVPRELVELAARSPLGLHVRDAAGDEPVFVLPSGLEHPVSSSFCQPEAKLEEMDRDGIDTAIVSVSPSLVLTIDEPAAARRACAAANEGAAAYVESGRGRLHAMACVPLMDPPAAVDELRRAHELGMVGVLAGTSVGARMLDAPELDPFFAAAAEAAMPVMLHPYLSMAGRPAPGLELAGVANAVGNPYETFLAASWLIVGGVLDRHPGLVVVLVHGGGSLPYQVARLAHAYAGVGPDGPARPADAYLDRFLFDTVVFDRRMFEFLVSRVGAEAVAFGSDRPFAMADLSGIDNALALGGDAAEAILSGNASRAFGIAAERMAQ
jgi:aminocarboxymuconate-semialdehyde decarboxylase